MFPEMFGTVFNRGILKKALEKGLIDVQIHNLRDFATGKHRVVDDRPYGGGQGMVLKPEPIFEAVKKIRQKKEIPVYLLSPQGKRFDFLVAGKLAKLPQIILLCGRYEGVDERVVQYLVTEEISIGDYVLTGGEPAAVVVVDVVSRFIPDVVGNMESVKYDSFSEGLLDFPQYTRPRNFMGMEIPDILFSGDHKKIAYWRKQEAIKKTRSLRPDLIKDKEISSGKRLDKKGMKDGID